MCNVSRDKERILNFGVIYEDIKRGIDVTFTNECYGSAVILIYAGIDVMAYLSMQPKQIEVQPKDFIAWAERYIRFPCREQLTGTDLYGARCAMLHQYGVESRRYREGKCRMVGYVDHSVPEVSYNPEISTELVIISIQALKDAFFAGVDKFLPELFSDESKRSIAEKRLDKLVQKMPMRSE
jgi:hypothetical protein